MMLSLKNTKIALLQGGPGAERKVSLRCAAAVGNALRELGADVADIDVVDASFELPAGIHLAFNMIPGTFGEDGGIQTELDRRGVPYTGDGAAASRAAFDKIESKRRFEAAGVPTPRWEVLHPGGHPAITVPLVAKPPREGSSVGVHIVKSADALEEALADCFSRDHEVLIEDFVPGRELTVGILGNEALPVIEIVPKSGFYDYRNKYTKGASDYFCPAPLDAETTSRVQDAALAAYRALGLEVYGRADILLGAGGEVSVLEINTIPGMTETSLLPKAAAVAGIGFAPLCAKIVELSLAKGGSA